MKRKGAPVQDTATPPQPRALIVELFTTSGCEACASADSILAAAAAMRQVDSIKIVPIVEHVTVGAPAGSQDPLALSICDKRQKDYAGALKHAEMTPPQIVMDGMSVVPKISRSDLDRALKQTAAIERVLQMRFKVLPPDPDARPNPNAMRVMVGVRQDAKGDTTTAQSVDDAAPADVYLLVTERGVAGSPAGSAVVRSMSNIAQWIWGGPYQGTAMVRTLDLDPSWKRENLYGVAFVQTKGSGRILGVAEISLNVTPAEAAAGGGPLIEPPH